ncbi:predicted protein [Lichtheimia corymbifera JMRC:FSU:9682]|uniref:Uncharacterized protein n=1 Tax=Lichtheimia corymbifera JMRC:FSU:9682 TaxID=1263082 RepID=A0A068SEQ6_9FUNG|nr:predicted protein [Lichtheimia corymbifera JMRC:FSU:9682]
MTPSCLDDKYVEIGNGTDPVYLKRNTVCVVVLAKGSGYATMPIKAERKLETCNDDDPCSQLGNSTSKKKRELLHLVAKTTPYRKDSTIDKKKREPLAVPNGIHPESGHPTDPETSRGMSSQDVQPHVESERNQHAGLIHLRILQSLILCTKGPGPTTLCLSHNQAMMPSNPCLDDPFLVCPLSKMITACAKT